MGWWGEYEYSTGLNMKAFDGGLLIRGEAF